ncbi:MAG: serine protease [Alcaligenaceae bacterium]
MRLTQRGFLISLAILIVLNLFVYLWWMNRPIVVMAPAQMNREIVAGLQTESQRLQLILDGSCEGPELQAFRRGEIGPLVRQEQGSSSGVPPQVPGQRPGAISTPAPTATANTPTPATTATPAQVPPAPLVTPPTEPSAAVLPQDKLVALLDAATVRVLVFDANRKFLGHGSGFFIEPNVIVTNRHVIEIGKSFAITSTLLGADPIPAQLAAVTKDSEITNPDFALLKVERAPTGARQLAIATEPPVLSTVVAAGYPGSDIRGDTNVVTPNTVFSQGEVSVLQRQSNNLVLVLHTAKMSTGSSGGPLVNRCGNVVGVNTFIGAREDQFTDRSLYALSATSLRGFLDQNGQRYTKMSSACTSDTKN